MNWHLHDQKIGETDYSILTKIRQDDEDYIEKRLKDNQGEVLNEFCIALTFHGCPHICQIKPIITLSKDGITIMAKDYPLGDLSDYLHLYKGKYFPLTKIKTFIQNIWFPIMAMHRKFYVHGDIKPANIFISKEEEFYLGDFSHTFYVGDDPNHKSETFEERVEEFRNRFPSKYSSPEVTLGNKPTFASDIYSFAKVIQDLVLASRIPKQHSSLLTVLNKATYQRPEGRQESVKALVRDLKQAYYEDLAKVVFFSYIKPIFFTTFYILIFLFLCLRIIDAVIS